jgi:hypothetical protein
MTPATQQVTTMHAEAVAELSKVRADYPTLALASRLAARHGMRIEDAMMEEAKQRLRRAAWAKVTA